MNGHSITNSLPSGIYALVCTEVALRLAACPDRTGVKHSPGRVPDT